jgi:hypothetical protein
MNLLRCSRLALTSRIPGQHYQKHVVAAHRADSYDKKPSRI